MLALGDDSLPPTALFWPKYVGDGDLIEYQLQGMVVHLLSGAVLAGLPGLNLRSPLEREPGRIRRRL